MIYRVKIIETCSIKIGENWIAFKGPFGMLVKKKSPHLKIYVKDNYIFLKAEKLDQRKTNFVINNFLNCMWGVTRRFIKTLVLKGIGFKASLSDKNTISLNLGYSHEKIFKIPNTQNLNVDIKEEDGFQINIRGASKEAVGLLGWKLKQCRLPDNYKGKGIRYIDEQLRLKEGKKNNG